MDRNDFDAMPIIHKYDANDAVEDGALIALADPPPEPKPAIKPLREITSMDDYLRSYGKILGRRAINALTPLHVPSRDPLPEFDDMLRKPFEPQKHVIAAAVKMMSNTGSGFIVGEMGTGKTLLGMTSVHKHAQKSRRQGGKGGKYRAIVLCPDHLISKWCRELKETIPGAVVHRFGPSVGDVDEDDAKITKGRKKGKAKAETGSKQTLRDTLALLAKKNGDRWTKPEGAEWFVMGRNQAKWLSDWIGLSDVKRGFDGRESESISQKTIVIEKIPAVDGDGKPIMDRKTFRQKMQAITAKVYVCPHCGTVARDKKGVPLSAKDLSVKPKSASQKRCKGIYAREIVDPEKTKEHGTDILCPLPSRYGEKKPADHRNGKPADEFSLGGRRYRVMACNEPLYAYTSSPYRWAPARIIQMKMKRMFQYMIIDECHEQKSEFSGQSMACGKLISSVNHVLALTGTIIGGYAHHLYPLLMRISPETLRDEGFEWGKDLAFAEAYGRIDRIVTTKENDPETNVSGNVKSMRRAKSGDSSERKAVRPGVMPTMFGRHMIGSSIFITLDEMADELPDLCEYIGGPFVPSGDPERDAKVEAGWCETAVDMEPAQAAEYRRVDGILELANRELLKTGSMKLLGAYLWTTMDYPDRPWGWGHDPEVLKAFEEYRRFVLEEMGPEAAAKVVLPHTVGFWDKPGSRKFDNFVGVVTPKDCDVTVVYPKEQRLIDICKKQKAEGRQTWVYVQMTGKRNIQPRLKVLLEAEGLRVGVLRANDVDPKEREDWIAANGRDYDVMLSHPQLVSTGLDLFSKAEGGHNYSTLVFYETGYNLFTMRQAARRAWRIGQPMDCRVYYLYYKETMQHRAMQLMSRKMAAAQALEGEFSEEGLAAMAGEDNLQMALAKSLADRIDQADMQRSWSKVKSNPVKKGTPVTRTASPIRVPWPMPRIQDLAQMSDAMLNAFRKLASRPDSEWTRQGLGCIGETIEKLVNLGLAEPGSVAGHWRCKLHGKTLAQTLTWINLYGHGFGIYLPMGVVIANHPEKGDHYVKVVNHQALSKGVEFLPVDTFPHGNSIPYCAFQEELKAWRLVEASDEDRQTLAGVGLFKWAHVVPVPSKLDGLNPEAQMIAEAMLDSQAHPIDPAVAAEYAEIAQRLAATDRGFLAMIPNSEDEEEGADGGSEELLDPVAAAFRVYEPEDAEDREIPELTEDILAKMFANMIANGSWTEAS